MQGRRVRRPSFRFIGGGGREKRKGLRLKFSCAVKDRQHLNLSFMNLIEQPVALDEQFTNGWIIQLRDYSSPFR